MECPWAHEISALVNRRDCVLQRAEATKLRVNCATDQDMSKEPSGLTVQVGGVGQNMRQWDWEPGSTLTGHSAPGMGGKRHLGGRKMF